MNKLKRFFSSIGVKLFLVFWITAILSIALTHFVTDRLAQESIILPLEQKDIAKLTRLATRINNQGFQQPERVIHFIDNNFRQLVFIKAPNTGRIYHQPKRFAMPLADYLRRNDIANQTSVLFRFARLSGPVNMDINGESYQLFIASRVRRDDVSETLLLLPHWLRTLVPIMLSMCFCWIFAKYLTKPVRAMESAAITIGDGDFKARVKNIGNRQDELGQLAKSFNLMAEKLENNISAHQRLLADVSHELRSPLTRLQITLGLLDKALPSTDSKQKLLDRCEKEVMQLDAMIGNVLTLSRLENTIDKQAFTTCNLSQLLTIVVEDAQMIANEKAISITLSSPEKLSLMANEALLTSAFTNILSNAIKYTPVHGAITVEVTCHKHTLDIIFQDDGCGVEESQLGKLFDPFYRTSDARDRDSGGTGLGLAITKQAIEKHNGSIIAYNNLQQGLSVKVILPITQ